MSELTEIIQSISQYLPQKTIDDIYQLISAPIKNYPPSRSKEEVIEQIDWMLSEIRSKCPEKSGLHHDQSPALLPRLIL